MRLTSTNAMSLATLAVAMTACRMAPSTTVTNAAATARAQLADSAGHSVGTATFTQDAAGVVHIHVEAMGLATGDHGIHFHAVGSCVGPAFTSAGGHFNPASKHHGLHNPQGPHAGDLPNLVVTGEHTSWDATTDRVTLTDGPNSVFDADGTAFVIHAGKDDQMTDPAGNSGARIACGVITR
jgi:Cu-Zn family superoxide dismutase